MQSHFFPLLSLNVSILVSSFNGIHGEKYLTQRLNSHLGHDILHYREVFVVLLHVIQLVASISTFLGWEAVGDDSNTWDSIAHATQ